MSTRRVLRGEHATAMSPGMITLVAGWPYQIGGVWVPRPGGRDGVAGLS
ncbi:hypothetical protein [Prescottella equi]|nr:hypothetical protein [Prescottella equi]